MTKTRRFLVLRRARTVTTVFGFISSAVLLVLPIANVQEYRNSGWAVLGAAICQSLIIHKPSVHCTYICFPAGIVDDPLRDGNGL